MKKLGSFAVFSLLLLALPAAAETPKIGVILPLTGSFARYGDRIRASIDRELKGKATLLLEDEQCNPLTAVKSYQKLTDVDGVKVFLGPWCGSPQEAIAPRLPAAKQVAILGSSASAAVYRSSGQRMFSTQHTIEEESIFNAEALEKRGIQSVVIVFFDNAFSRAHEAAFRGAYHGKVLETIAYTSDDASQLKSVALRIKVLTPDAVYFPDAFPLLQGIGKELAALQLQGIPLFGVYSLQSADVIAALPPKSSLTISYPDIGDQDALDHFPKQAAEIAREMLGRCGEDANCIRDALLKSGKFDGNGVLRQQLILKQATRSGFIRAKD